MGIVKKRQAKKAASKRAAAIAANPDIPNKNDGYDAGVGVLHGPDLPSRQEQQPDPYTGRHTPASRDASNLMDTVRSNVEQKAAATITGKTAYAKKEELHRVMPGYQPAPISGLKPSVARFEGRNGRAEGLEFTPSARRGGGNELAVDAIRASQGTPRNEDTPTLMGKAHYVSPVPDRGSNPARVVDHR